MDPARLIRMIKGSAILCALALACVSASAETITWSKPDGTQQDFGKDSAKCRVDAANVFAPLKAAIINARQPTQMNGGIAVRQSPLEGAARMAQIASLNDQEKQMVSDCLVGEGWIPTVIK